MKKIFGIGTFILLIILVLFNSATTGLAQDVVPPTPTAQNNVSTVEEGFVPFSAMGETDNILRGPYDGTSIRFTPPASWKLGNSATLHLAITAAFSSSNPLQGGTGANLTVDFNGVNIADLYIEQEGYQNIQIPIPPQALITARVDGRHTIDITLDAAFDCTSSQQTTIIVHASSILELQHSLASPDLDLSKLPRPFYQLNSFLPENTLLVIPNNPTANELQAALTISAAFGRMSAGRLDFQLLTYSELTNDLLANSHLILVGNSPEIAALLQQASFTPPLKSQPEDGILQMALSPWNPYRVLMHVSGSDEAGVIKAAQALTYGSIQPGVTQDTTVISSINPDISESTVADVRTFADLGYSTRNIGLNGSSLGVIYLDYNFYLPPGYTIANGAFIGLDYSHSALIDFNNSGLTVVVNDQPIGSYQFTEETAAQVNKIQVPVDSELLHQGDNLLELQIEMLPANTCSAFANRGAWFTVYSSSLLDLPLIPAAIGTLNNLINLNLYPMPFTSTPTLSDVGFVLSKEDTNSWKIASQLSLELGSSATGKVLLPKTAFADNLTDEFLNNHLILIGIPTQLPILAQMTNAMPAPFEEGNNIVTERTLTVEYRLPEGASMGYIELFTSPWESSRWILTLLGSTPEGLGWTYDAISTSSLRGQITGNFVAVNQNKVFSTDTRISPTTIIPSAVPVTTLDPSAATPVGQNDNAATSQYSPRWILIAIITVSILIMAIIAFTIKNTFTKKDGKK